MVFFHESSPQFFLVRGWNPANTEDLLTRSNIVFRITVALEAPTHEQCVDLHHKRHLVNLAMARCATDPFLHMDAVIEVNKVG